MYSKFIWLCLFVYIVNVSFVNTYKLSKTNIEMAPSSDEIDGGFNEKDEEKIRTVNLLQKFPTFQYNEDIERNKNFIYSSHIDENGNQIFVISPANPKKLKDDLEPKIVEEDVIRPVESHPLENSPFQGIQGVRAIRQNEIVNRIDNDVCPSGYLTDSNGICRLVW